MRVLFVTPYFPYPLNDGAKIRDYNLIVGLSRYCEVYLLSFLESRAEEEYRLALQPYCRGIHTVIRRQSGPMRWRVIRYAWNLLSSKPFAVQDFWSAEMASELSRLCRNWNIDVVQIEKLQMASYYKFVPEDTLRILDEHNVETVMYQRYSQMMPNPLARLYMRLQWQKARRFESKVGLWFDVVFTVTRHDTHVLNQLTRGRVETILTGVDIDYFRDEASPEEYNQTTDGVPSFDLVYTGTMSWFPNRDAILFFANDIFPLVKQHIPHARLFVVGRNPTSDIQRLARRCSDIVVTGQVADVRPYVRNADAMIAPIRVGSGVKTKVLEAMAMGKPVVATPEAAEGIEAINGQHLLVASDSDQFVSYLCRLATDSDLRRTIGKKARELIEEKYDWDIITTDLYARYERLVREKRNDNPL